MSKSNQDMYERGNVAVGEKSKCQLSCRTQYKNKSFMRVDGSFQFSQLC